MGTDKMFFHYLFLLKGHGQGARKTHCQPVLKQTGNPETVRIGQIVLFLFPYQNRALLSKKPFTAWRDVIVGYEAAVLQFFVKGIILPFKQHAFFCVFHQWFHGPEVIAMAINHLDQRFGTAAIKMGFITPEQLLEALKIQVKENLDNSSHRLIGSILQEAGYMNFQQIDQVLKEIL